MREATAPVIHLGMGSGIIVAAAFAAFAVQSTSNAQAQDGWQPITTFYVPASADRCIALQGFQRNGQKLRLGLESRPGTDDYVLLIEGPGNMARKAWIQGKIRIAGAKPAKDYSVIEPSSKADSLIYLSRVKRAELDAAGRDARLEIIAGSNSLDLTVPGLGVPLSMLDACSGELLEKWGYSKEFQRGVASYPRPEKELREYASSSDYPASAVRSGAMGETHALISVGIEGRASGCQIIRSSGHAELDSASCNIITKRVRFVPARALDGTAIAAPAYLTMKWELPR